MLRLLTALLLAFLLGSAVGAAPGVDGLQPIPPLQARVTDLSATLSAEQTARLEAAIAGFERASGGQIAVLMLPTTAPEAIEAYALRVAEAWKIGRRGSDDGIVIVVAKADRRMRIEVGYGLEGAIPDAIAKRIVAEQMGPRFAVGDFAGGLNAAIDALAAALAREPAKAPPAAAATGPKTLALLGEAGGESLLMAAVVAAALIGKLLRLLLGDLPGAAVTGAGTGVVGWLVSGSVATAGVAALGGFIVAIFGLSLALNFLGSGRGGRGGGFGGGGGGFGGGGASGRW